MVDFTGGETMDALIRARLASNFAELPSERSLRRGMPAPPDCEAETAQRVVPRNAMPDRDWSAATPGVREAELLALAQSNCRNALRLGLFENPRTKAQASHQLEKALVVN